MLHKKYNYKRPLTTGVIFLAIFFKSNSITQINRNENSVGQRDIAFIPKKKLVMAEPYVNSINKKSYLLSIYYRFISQFPQ
ncbi:MAG: hypothetical protein M3015_05450 [Bacteroidota bacterium]|nr:hypothetical protein [Bacteroidota bacterium]